MNKPTLNDFLFSLNQDEDILVSVVDYDSDDVFFTTEWKSCLAKKDIYSQYKDWLVIFFEVGRVGQYNSCLNIYISKEDPDNE